MSRIITLRIDGELLKRLDTLAMDCFTDRSTILRALVAFGLSKADDAGANLTPWLEK